MNFKKRYNDAIQEIERAIDRREDHIQIPELIAKHSGTNVCLLGNAVQYITNMTLHQYIKQRRLAKAMQFKFDTECSLEEAAEEFGFSDAPTMSKAFKRAFDVSPSKMSEDELKKIVPFSLELLLQEEENNATMEIQPKSIAPIPETVFGVSVEQFEDIKSALELNAVYGLSDKLANFAYKLYKEQKVPLSKAFEFVEDLDLQFENGTYLGALSNICLDEIVYLCFRYDLSVSECIDTIDSLHGQGIDDITELHDDFFVVYFGEANRLNGFSAQDILDFVDTMDEEGIDAAEFDQIVTSYALLHDNDIIETIRCFAEDENFDLTQLDVLRDQDEYPQVWEHDEDEYHDHLTEKLSFYAQEEQEYGMCSEHKHIDECWDTEEETDDL